MAALLARVGIALWLIMACIGPWLLAAPDPWYVSCLAFPWLGVVVCWLLLPLAVGNLPASTGGITCCLLGILGTTLFQALPVPADFAKLIAPDLQARLAVLRPESQANWVTLSADASATLDLFARMAAFTLLFLGVRGLTSVSGVLSMALTGWVLLVNGTLLSLEAMAQAATSAPEIIYWTWITPGRVFGPFICKNHYPYYMNMALGSAFGLMGAAYHDFAPRSRDGRLRRDQFWEPLKEALRSPVFLLHNPAILGVVMGLVLMIASIPMSMSRGGVVASVAALLATLWMVRRASPRWTGTTALPVAALAALPVAALIAWFGMAQVESRLSTLTKLETFQDDRFSLWNPLIAVFQRNPLLGTGGGTTPLVEPLERRRGGFTGVVVDHAHNEYLEAAVEGGIIRLGFTAALAAMVLLAGWRAIRIHAGTALLPMAAGLTFAAFAVIIHSSVDFGMHMGAVACLAAILLGQLDYLASGESSVDKARRTVPDSLPGWAVIPLLAPVVVVFMSLQTQGAAYRLQIEADTSPATAAGFARRVDLYEAAIRLRPRAAEPREALGLAILNELNRRADEIDGAGQARQEMAMLGSALAAIGPGVTQVETLVLAAGAALAPPKAEDGADSAIRGLGWKRLREAAVLSPFLHRAQTALALDPEASRPAESLERAARAYPIDHELWWTAGRAWWNDAAKANGTPDSEASAMRALSAWREALARGSPRLPEIIAACLEVSNPDRYLAIVMPDKPRVLIDAAKTLKGEGENAERRAALLSLARRELEGRGSGAEASDWKALADLSKGENRVAALRQATLLASGKALGEIRLDLAWELEATGQLDEAEALARRIGGENDSPRLRELLRFLERDRQLEPYLPRVDFRQEFDSPGVKID